MKNNLRFDSNGKFKIVQFTDIHEGPSRDKSIDLMNKILDYENPNMVILSEILLMANVRQQKM